MHNAKFWVAPVITSLTFHALLLGFLLFMPSINSPISPASLVLQFSAPTSAHFSDFKKAQSAAAAPFKAVSAAIRSNTSTTGTPPSNPSLESSYANQVRQELEQRKNYPAPARILGQSGRVLLQFEVRRDGTVANFTLLEKSPFPSLNQAALDLLQSLKLPPIPQELQKVSWKFTFPLEYRLD